MIDTVVILFLVLGAFALYTMLALIRDHYTNGPLYDDESDAADHSRFVHGCIAFVVFYCTILLMTMFAPARAYVMLTFSVGLAVFLLIYVASEFGRNRFSPIFFKSTFAATKGSAEYVAAVAWNLLFVTAALYWVIAEYQALSAL